jgi:hypothetical protein
MTPNLSQPLAHAIADDRLRAAQQRRTTRSTGGRFRRLMSRH